MYMTLAVNSVAMGGLLFLLSAGFSLIFGLMRIPNLMHGSFFMLGAYIGFSLMDPPAAMSIGGGTFPRYVFPAFWPAFPFWIAVVTAGLAMAALGGLIERYLLRRLAGQTLPQVLLTLGLSFMIADICLMIWTGDPFQPPTPAHLRGAWIAGDMVFPIYRLAMLAVACVVAVLLWLMVDKTRIGAMIRAGVDDPDIARVVGIKVSQLFTLIFCLGAGLAGFAGVIGAPFLSIYPGLDAEMLPLALIIVILGGSGSLLGAFVGSFIIAFLFNFGQAMFPNLAYVILFLPMVLILVLRPQGLFGKLA